MRSKIPAIISILLVICIFQACKKKEEAMNNQDCSTVNAHYTSDIQPLVAANCSTVGCHDSGSSVGDFTTYAGLKAKADNGTLKARVVDNNSMPPSTGLDMTSRKKISCWIMNGSLND
jgi:hypothetical protein